MVLETETLRLKSDSVVLICKASSLLSTYFNDALLFLHPISTISDLTDVRNVRKQLAQKV